jgi:HEAT repeat protein
VTRRGLADAAARLLALQEGEARQIAPAAAFQLCFVAGTALLKASANALVVARFEAAALPWLYIAAAIFTGLFAVIDGTLRKTTAPPRGSLALAALLTCALAAGAWLGALPAVAALYVFAEAYATVTSVRFWAALGERFDARASKRLFGVVGGFGMGGSVIGGMLGGFGAVVGAIPLLALPVLSMLGCAALGMILARRSSASAGGARTISVFEMRAVSEPIRRAILEGGEALRFLRDNAFTRALAVLAALAAVLTVVADYLFRVSAQGVLDEDRLAAFFGASSFAVGLLAMLFQLFLSGRVLARWGIFRYLAIAPVGTAGLAALCAIQPGLAPAFLLKVLENLGALSLQPTGMQLLYGPLPDKARISARAFIDGLVKKGGAALGGLALLVVSPWLGRAGLAVAVVAVSLLVLGMLVLVKRRYVATIDKRLTRARWDEGLEMDAEARSLLLKSLEDRDPARVLLAVDLLAADRSANIRPWVPILLSHPSERVRERGVRLALELGARELVPRLRAIAMRDVRRPRDEAVLALARLDEQAAEFLAPMLEAKDPGLRGAAVAALARIEHERGEASGPASRALERMLAQSGGSVAERRELAKLLGRMRGTRFAKEIDPLLDDPDPSVRRIALASAAECGRYDLAPRMIEALAEREVRRAAREALASMGDRIAGLLEEALNDKRRPARVRYELPRLLRYLGTERAVHILLFSNIEDDPFLRHRIAVALSRLRRAREDLPFDAARTREATLRRVDAYLYYLPIFRDLQRALGEGAILVRALGDRLDQNVEIIFRLLGLVHPQRTMLNIHNRLLAEDPRERAYALELFDNLVDEGIRERVVPVLERHHRLPGGQGVVERAPARLLELAVSRDAVLRACAIYTLRRRAPEAAALQIIEEGTVSETVMEKVFLLEGVGIFEHCSVDDLAALAAIAHERRFQAGKVIYRENDPGDALYVVIDGRVAVEKDGKTILEMTAKEAFGEASLLDGAPRPAGARALADTRALAIDRQDFLDLVSDRPELLKGLFGALTRQLRLVLEMASAGRITPPKAEAQETKAAG